jgi:hypothetical protein
MGQGNGYAIVSYPTILLNKEIDMNETNRIKYLRIALWVFGLAFIFGIWLLSKVWSSGWSWHTEGRSYYFEMILGIYATLGIFLILAAQNPLKHLSLIWFAVWSSVVHGGIMLVQAFDSPHNMGHLYGDVLVLFVVAAVLGFLTPREGKLSVS